MGRSMMPWFNICLKIGDVFNWLRCSEGARPRRLPEGPRVSVEDFEGRQWANERGTERLIVGRVKTSVGRAQWGNGWMFDLTEAPSACHGSSFIDMGSPNHSLERRNHRNGCLLY